VRLRATIRIRNDAMLAARHKRGWSQAQAAQAAGVHAITVLNFEKMDYTRPKDRDLLLSHAMKIAIALEITVDDVLPEGYEGTCMLAEQSIVKDFSLAELPDVWQHTKAITESTVDMVQEKERSDAIDDLIGKMPERTAEIIRCRFGLEGREFATHNALGERLGISKARSQQIEAKSIRQLKRDLELLGYGPDTPEEVYLWRHSAIAREEDEYHCFTRWGSDSGGYISLCKAHYRKNPGGVTCQRPPLARRCAKCESEEISFRNWQESGPQSQDWVDY